MRPFNLMKIQKKLQNLPKIMYNLLNNSNNINAYVNLTKYLKFYKILKNEQVNKWAYRIY